MVVLYLIIYIGTGLMMAHRLIYIDNGRCHDVNDIAELRGTYYR